MYPVRGAIMLRRIRFASGMMTSRDDGFPLLVRGWVVTCVVCVFGYCVWRTVQ